MTNKQHSEFVKNKKYYTDLLKEYQFELEYARCYLKSDTKKINELKNKIKNIETCIKIYKYEIRKCNREFNKKIMCKTNEYWVVRKKNGIGRLFDSEPIYDRINDMWFTFKSNIGVDAHLGVFIGDMFPEVTYENSPKKVLIKYM